MLTLNYNELYFCYYLKSVSRREGPISGWTAAFIHVTVYKERQQLSPFLDDFLLFCLIKGKGLSLIAGSCSPPYLAGSPFSSSTGQFTVVLLKPVALYYCWNTNLWLTHLCDQHTATLLLSSQPLALSIVLLLMWERLQDRQPLCVTRNVFSSFHSQRGRMKAAGGRWQQLLSHTHTVHLAWLADNNNNNNNNDN